MRKGRIGPAEEATIVRHAAAGGSWAGIAAEINARLAARGVRPVSLRAVAACWERRATEHDRAARRRANAGRCAGNRGGGPATPAAADWGALREKRDPWAGMGDCFR